MPGTQNRNEDVFAKYNAMSTEELQQILREDASKPEGQEETSTEALYYIMEVLAQRRRARNEGKTPEEALEAFRKYYEEGEIPSKPEREPVVQKKNPITPNWIKRLVAAAAIIILIFSGTLTAKAFGFDLWEVIVKWTQETFHFGYASDDLNNDPNSHNKNVFTGLQDALDNYDITLSLVPQWLPDGYKELDLRVEDTPKQRRFIAIYQYEDKTVRVRIVDYLGTAPTQVEQSEQLIETYNVEGINYYIFENDGQLQAVWTNQNYECYISGPVSLSELKCIIDSIKKG